MPHAYVSLSPSVSVLAVAYTTVLLAELVGDKSVYTIAALGLRFRPLPVFGGLTLAFMGKMLAAVLFGKTLFKVPGHWADARSGLSFFACALFIWFKEPSNRGGTCLCTKQSQGIFWCTVGAQ